VISPHSGSAEEHHEATNTASFPPAPELLTAQEVADFLRVSRGTVLEWSRRGLLRCVVLRVGRVRAVRRWRRVDVEALISPTPQSQQPTRLSR